MSEKYFITGATGLVGAALTEHLASEDNEVVVYARSPEKAKKLFSHLGNVSIVAGMLEEPVSYEGEIDYIIHAAAPTNSTFFVEKPVETIDSIVLGTKSMLELARQKKVKSIVNLSSMEVYGTPTDEQDLTEDQQFYLDPLTIRSNYPIAKRLAENMSVAYATEYDVPVKIARLAQVLGKELLPDDNRVVAQFARAAKNGQDIEIATDGLTKQTYVGIDDTISGILTILNDGEDGQAYNLANESTYCSILDVAHIFADEAGGSIKVTAGTDTDTSKYPPNRTLKVNSGKLRDLGWEPKTSLQDALRGLLDNQ